MVLVAVMLPKSLPVTVTGPVNVAVVAVVPKSRTPCAAVVAAVPDMVVVPTTESEDVTAARAKVQPALTVRLPATIKTTELPVTVLIVLVVPPMVRWLYDATGTVWAPPPYTTVLPVPGVSVPITLEPVKFKFKVWPKLPPLISKVPELVTKPEQVRVKADELPKLMVLPDATVKVLHDMLVAKVAVLPEVRLKSQFQPAGVAFHDVAEAVILRDVPVKEILPVVVVVTSVALDGTA